MTEVPQSGRIKRNKVLAKRIAVADKILPYIWTAYFASIIVDVILARSPLAIGSFFFAAADLGSFQIAFSFAASVIVLQEALGGGLVPTLTIAHSIVSNDGTSIGPATRVVA